MIQFVALLNSPRHFSKITFCAFKIDQFLKVRRLLKSKISEKWKKNANKIEETNVDQGWDVPGGDLVTQLTMDSLTVLRKANCSKIHFYHLRWSPTLFPLN